MFLKRAYDAVVDQNKDFAVALLASGYCILWHSIGIAGGLCLYPEKIRKSPNPCE